MPLAVTTSGANGCSYDPCSSFSVALTLTSVTNALIAMTFARDGRYCGISTCTYNGVGLTKYGTYGAGTLWGEVSLWYMISPPTGSSYNLSVGFGSCAGQYLLGWGLSGANILDLFSDVDYTVGCCNTNISHTLTTTAGGIAFMGTGWDSSLGWGSGQSTITGWADSNTDGTAIGAHSSQKASGGTSTTVSSSTGGWSYAASFGVNALPEIQRPIRLVSGERGTHGPSGSSRKSALNRRQPWGYG